MTRTRKIVLGCSGTFLAILIVGGYIVVGGIVDAAFQTILHPPRHPVSLLKSQGIPTTPQEAGVEGVRLTLENPGDPTLVAWWLPRPNPDAPVAILVHGLGARSEHMLGTAERIHRLGAACLAVDLRGHGESQDRVWFGTKEREDLGRWIDHLRTIGFRPARLGLYGGSYGGAVVLQAAATLPAVNAVIAFHPFTDFDEAICDHLELGIGQRRIPILDGWLRGKFCSQIELAGPAEVSALSLFSQAGRIPPVLLIHGDQDRTLNIDHSRRLAQAFPQQVRLIEIPGAGHDDLFHRMSPAVQREIDSFLRTHLLD